MVCKQTLMWMGLCAGCAGPSGTQPDASSLGDDGPLVDASADGGVVVGATCPNGPTAQSFIRTTDIAYSADHTTTSTTRHPLGAICLPVTAAGQGFYLESKIIRGSCNVYDACEAGVEIKCFDAHGALVHPQLWSGENYLNGSSDSAVIARLMVVTTSASPVTCQAEFYNHDHGIAGGTITVRAGSTFNASGPLAGVGATPDSGGRIRLTSARPTTAMKTVAGWHMPAGHTKVSYIGDIQATECHVPYPTGATDPNTQCVTSEPAGPDTAVQYWAQAYEEYPDGTTCHVTDGVKSTASIATRVHHKMLYTALSDVPHTPGCADVWHFAVHVQWVSGRTFMIQSGPYGQGMVRPR